MWNLDHKEGWVPKNWCFRTVVLENILESLLDCREIKPVNPKGNQPWIFFGRTDGGAETLILWPPDAKSQLTGKDLNAGENRRQEEKGATEDGTVGWHHRLDGHEFEQAPGVGNGHGSQACCSPQGCKESDTTEWLNNNDRKCASWISKVLTYLHINLPAYVQAVIHYIFEHCAKTIKAYKPLCNLDNFSLTGFLCLN